MWRIICPLMACLFFMECFTSYGFNEPPSVAGQSAGDGYSELDGQLQGMKAALEDMRRDYERRFGEMQEKIAFLENKGRPIAENTLQPSRDAEAVRGENKDAPGEKNTPVSVAGKSREMESNPAEVGKNDSSLIEKRPDAPYSQPEEPLQTASAAPQAENPEIGKWSPAQPLTLLSSGKSYMNISFDGLFAAAGTTGNFENLETGGHDPNQRGFTVQNLETTFDGAIDPYFNGQASMVFQIDKDGESFLEVEEAFLTSMSLPMDLQVKAGTFFTEFGRLNPQHPHAWSFADQPLVNGRFLGPDGLRGPGARLSWLAPTSNYTELFFAVQNSQGETAHSFRNEEALFGREAAETRVRSMDDMLYTQRIATSFDVTNEQTLLLGASAAFGPNSTGTDRDTLIYGLDMFWKWKSRYASGGFPFVTWQTEVMGRHFEAGEDVDAGLPEETMDNWGAYSQVCWGFNKRWVAGIRGDYVDGEKEAADPLGFERWRLSPNLTFYSSEFSKIRLQYNYDDVLGNNSSEHSVMLQCEFLLGSHGAHKF
ncbi:MAG TPA: hypothetical protein VJ440_07675 [Candidatus Brocadiaceae bacterium]|nr:hypothetical protein [Candidatus Brocadiaceae bacterium]